MENTEKIYPYQIMDINDLDGEIWKDVKDFEGYYQVSNYGRVKSVERKVTRSNSYRTIKPRIMKQQFFKGGYLYVHLRNAVKELSKNFTVHRLVAKAFLDDFNEELQTNHIDEDKKNNCVDNLNMMTCRENNNFGTRNERASKALTNHPNKSRQVGQYDLNNNLIIIYPSTMEAERQGGFYNTHISACCNGKIKTHKGFQWRYI